MFRLRDSIVLLTCVAVAGAGAFAGSAPLASKKASQHHSIWQKNKENGYEPIVVTVNPDPIKPGGLTPNRRGFVPVVVTIKLAKIVTRRPVTVMLKVVHVYFQSGNVVVDPAPLAVKAPPTGQCTIPVGMDSGTVTFQVQGGKESELTFVGNVHGSGNSVSHTVQVK